MLVERVCVRAFRLVSLLGLIEFRSRVISWCPWCVVHELELGVAPWTASRSERSCGRVPCPARTARVRACVRVRGQVRRVRRVVVRVAGQGWAAVWTLAAARSARLGSMSSRTDSPGRRSWPERGRVRVAWRACAGCSMIVWALCCQLWATKGHVHPLCNLSRVRFYQ